MSRGGGVSCVTPSLLAPRRGCLLPYERLDLAVVGDAPRVRRWLDVHPLVVRMILFLDFETRSQADLKKVGAHRYAMHPSTEVISVSYCSLDGPVHHSFVHGDLDFGRDDVLVAHNASFEREVLHRVLGRHHERWCDTMALAAQLSLPLSLERLSEFFGLKKDMAGHKAMKKLSRPRPKSRENPHRDKFWEYEEKPDDWDMMAEYNENDVYIMRECYKRMLPLTRQEQRIWELTERMNARGVLIDMPGVLKAQALVERESKLLAAEFELLAGCSPRASKAVADVLGLPDAKADTIKKAVATNGDPWRARLLELRQLLAKSSVAKLAGFCDRVDDDSRLRGSLVYAGAQRTGRWAGRGVQLQNIPRGAGKATEDLFELLHADALDVVESPLRIIPEMLRGFLLGPYLVGDYAQIEARVTAWLAGDVEMLEEFASGGDPYVLMAAQIYRARRENVTKDQRFVGKQAVLGCGYGMGAAKFHATCLKVGNVDIPLPECQRIVEMYRFNRPRVKQLWYDTEAHFRNALEGHPNSMYQGVRVGGVPYIRGKLPSGRYLYYARPTMAWETDPRSGRNHLVLRYWGQNTYTRKWEAVKTYGGKLVENRVQAISRDIMAHSMLRLDSNDYTVLLTVHDEIVSADGDLEKFGKLMQEPPPWASGLPVGVETFRCERYRK